MFQMPSFGGADLIGAIAGGAMGILGSRSAKKAAEAQRRAIMEARGVNQRTLDNQRSIFNPYAQAGQTGLNRLTSRLDELTRRFGADDFVKDPGYDFRKQEGMNTLEGSAAARGGLFSGAAGRAITRYGQDYASNEYDKAYQRFVQGQDSEYNKLTGLVGIGQFGAQGLSGAESQFGQNEIGLITGAGNASAAGTIGAGNAWQQGIGQAYNAYRDQQILDRIPPQRTTYSGGNLGSGSFGDWRRAGGYPGEDSPNVGGY
jgi:hypothetical protein